MIFTGAVGVFGVSESTKNRQHWIYLDRCELPLAFLTRAAVYLLGDAEG